MFCDKRIGALGLVGGVTCLSWQVALLIKKHTLETDFEIVQLSYLRDFSLVWLVVWDVFVACTDCMKEWRRSWCDRYFIRFHEGYVFKEPQIQVSRVNWARWNLPLRRMWTICVTCPLVYVYELNWNIAVRRTFKYFRQVAILNFPYLSWRYVT